MYSFVEKANRKRPKNNKIQISIDDFESLDELKKKVWFCLDKKQSCLDEGDYKQTGENNLQLKLNSDLVYQEPSKEFDALLEPFKSAYLTVSTKKRYSPLVNFESDLHFIK